jgi:hypothetical protein
VKVDDPAAVTAMAQLAQAWAALAAAIGDNTFTPPVDLFDDDD